MNSTSLLKNVVVVGIYIYVSVLLSYQIFARGLANGSGTPAASPTLSRCSTLKLVQGTADRPFVFRRLMPEIVGLIHSAVPAQTRARIDRDMAADTTRNLFPGAAYHQANLMHSIAFLVWVAGLTGFAFTMRWLFRITDASNTALHDVGPVLCLLGVAAFGYVNFYCYDALTPLIFALALGLSITGRALLFWLLLIPAAYHKETAVVLPLIYGAFAMERLGARKTLLAAAAQLALIVSILLGLRAFYASNPGQSMELHFASNLHALTHPKLITLLLIAVMIGCVVAVRRALPHLPPGLRRSAIMLLPTAFVLYLITGMFLEVRSLLELWPLLSLILIPPLFAHRQQVATVAS